MYNHFWRKLQYISVTQAINTLHIIIIIIIINDNFTDIYLFFVNWAKIVFLLIISPVMISVNESWVLYNYTIWTETGENIYKHHNVICFFQVGRLTYFCCNYSGQLCGHSNFYNTFPLWFIARSAFSSFHLLIQYVQKIFFDWVNCMM